MALRMDDPPGWLSLLPTPFWLLHPCGSRYCSHYLQCDFCLLIPLHIVQHALQVSGSNSQERGLGWTSGTLIGQSSPSRPSHWLLTRLLIGCPESGASPWSNHLWPRSPTPMLLNIIPEIMDEFPHCLRHLELRILLSEQPPH